MLPGLALPAWALTCPQEPAGAAWKGGHKRRGLLQVRAGLQPFGT